MNSLASLFEDYHTTGIYVKKNKKGDGYLAVADLECAGERFSVFTAGGTPESALGGLETAVGDTKRWRVSRRKV